MFGGRKNIYQYNYANILKSIINVKSYCNTGSGPRCTAGVALLRERTTESAEV